MKGFTKGLCSLCLLAVGAVAGYYYGVGKMKEENNSTNTSTISGGPYMDMSGGKNAQTRAAANSDFENVQLVFANGSKSVAVSITPTANISGLILKVAIYDKDDKAIESFSRSMGDVVKDQTLSFTVTMSENGTTAGRGIYKAEIYVKGGTVKY